MTSSHRKTLLILHSYGSDYAWVRDVNIGVKRVIRGKTNYNILWHYMDTKNHPEEEYKQKAGIIARRVVDYVKPDVVLAIDDDAQGYVMKHYLNRDDIQIVFAGVNAKPSQYGYDKGTNVTGVLERIPYEGIKNGRAKASDIPIQNSPFPMVFMSEERLKIAGMSFPQIYEAFARATNNYLRNLSKVLVPPPRQSLFLQWLQTSTKRIRLLKL
eukprot:gene11688-11777_t